MIACGERREGNLPLERMFRAIKSALAPWPMVPPTSILITGAETSPNVTQSETFTASNPDNPNQIVVAYNDSRGRNASPINISGASVSTDGGNTFTRLTSASARARFPIPWATLSFCTIAQPAPGSLSGWTGAVVPKPRRLQVHHSLEPNSWTHYCIHNNNNDDRESGWADSNPTSPFYGRMYVS